jgi:hypothetical protein
MTLPASAALLETGERSFTHVLLGAVRREFRAEIYIPDSQDPVLFGPRCRVAGCRGRGHFTGAPGLGTGEYLCESHARQWRRAGRPEAVAWVTQAPAVRTQREAVACAIAGCVRSVDQNGCAARISGAGCKLGRPSLAAFAPVADHAPASVEECAIDLCTFAVPPGHGLCDAHHRSWLFLRLTCPEMDERGYLAHLAAARERSSPRYLSTPDMTNDSGVRVPCGG